jgi:pimeloyl-ACP methyl ester carboxylesterase
VRPAAAAVFLAWALPVAAEEAAVNGFRMHYEDHGHGEPVVFLHGFTLDSRMWDAQRATFTLAQAAEDVRALLDHRWSAPSTRRT